MKKTIILTMLFMVSLLFTACGDKNKEKEPTPAPEPPKEEVYTPKHQSQTVELASLKSYNYFNAPTNVSATAVKVTYDEKKPYAQPISIKYSYENGDSYTYTVPAEFGLWPNEAGKLRVVIDKEHTVWLQGQTKAGKFAEMVFFGNPNFNNTKVKPNSYKNPPVGEIKHVTK